jgi:hypothetical protein
VVDISFNHRQKSKDNLGLPLNEAPVTTSVIDICDIVGAAEQFFLCCSYSKASNNCNNLIENIEIKTN